MGNVVVQAIWEQYFTQLPMGQCRGVDDATDTNSGFGKLLLIRHTLPDGTQRDVLYEHILNIEINPRTGAKFKQDDPVYRGDTIARLGDANGHIPADLV